jgi:hypothetical protein
MLGAGLGPPLRFHAETASSAIAVSLLVAAAQAEKQWP